MIQETMDIFVKRHGCNLQDICFRIDDDCLDFTKDVGLQRMIKKGDIHSIADIIARINNKGEDDKIPQIRGKDLSRTLKEKMMKV